MHKLTTALTDNFQYISIENLNVKGMMANHKLAKAISDMGFYEFRRQLEYKAKLKGNIINVIDRWFPSSKTCCNCGNVKKDLTLKERIYKCKKCGIKLDRDFNASINIHNQLPIVHRKVTPVESEDKMLVLNVQGVSRTAMDLVRSYSFRFNQYR